jgi:hypothetical protein
MTVEVQALVPWSADDRGVGRRIVDGVSYSRLLLILAVLQKRCGYGASLGGTLCFINNPTLRLFSHISRTRLHTTSDDDQTRRHKKHKQKTNTITMVVESLAPPAAWI